MLGFSIFLNNDLTTETKDYIKSMKVAGFEGIFTSMHIPEDDATKYSDRLLALGSIAKELNLSLMVDISTKGLSALGLNLNDNPEDIRNLGVTGLRMDYGIPMETIANVSKVMNVGLNASTLTEREVEELQGFNADFSNFELWHNYYPRVETGLERSNFIKTNQWLRSLGLKIMTFVPGDGILRGPLYKHLPCLEEHRYMHPLAAAIDMFDNCEVDAVYIGDQSIKANTMDQFKEYFQNDLMVLPINVTSYIHTNLFIGTHTNRVDDARDAVRSQEARFKEFPTIQPDNTVTRSKGSVTLDNVEYQRYMGELQITKRDLEQDPRVNVVATIPTPDVDLVSFIKPGQRFKLITEGD
ncbi:DUF871 domain-containing protein [Vagococcus coleopterorum]|uniref:DUF871 domain-containing protein n=1 Tax=Vagococcus coleopterorum TaxID=2714946 RepID=A0A6G8ALI4_9ENTE|nr:MupG family TIM beta-alpha barrel fold protein [Vagococcus coleopterorum]QIL45819.1 DUF871 domain-containing protein [Vagococcus coleopterorum]